MTTVTPISGNVINLKNLKSYEDWRAFIHQVTPIVVSALVTLSVITENQAALWIPLFFAIIDPILSYQNTTDKVRKVIYGVVGLMQSSALVASLFGAWPEMLPVISAVMVALNSILARFYTPTNTLQPK